MTNAALKAAIVDYAKARPVFEQYKASKYSRKFLAEHEEKIALYRAAAAQSDSLLGGAKLPKMEVWGLPQQADFRRKSQLWPQLPCLPFSGTHKTPL